MYCRDSRKVRTSSTVCAISTARGFCTKSSKSRPRQWADSFRSFLQTNPSSAVLKSCQRKLADPSSPFYKRSIKRVLKSRQRKLADPSSPFYKPIHQAGFEIPPTAVGGSFKSFLQTDSSSAVLKSRQRQLADPSSPFYKRTSKPILIPLTAVGGYFRSLLFILFDE
jgi:hypothetical protein